MRIEPEQMIAAARQATGLDDFGGDSFREGLELLCESLSAEAQLNAIGEQALPGAIVGALGNRLRVVDWTKRHPEIADEVIEAPIIVAGIFRAGTTFLSYLLERDARNRPLMSWEASDSVPPPSPATFATDPRRDAARAQVAMMEQINPRFRQVQNEEPDGPTECIAMMNQDFRSVTWESMANIPSYGRWMHETDHRPTYAYHKQVLQLLQSGGVRGRWSLKAPQHAMHLDALTAVYPDAKLILIHRDPVVLTASVCSLIATLTGTFSDADHRHYIADHWLDMLDRSISGVTRFRESHPDHAIVDVLYADLVRDPIATMRRVYDGIGEPLDAQALDAMTTHVASRPKAKFGRHDYDPAEFGLDADAIAERFSEYTRRYDIPRETMRGV